MKWELGFGIGTLFILGSISIGYFLYTAPVDYSAISNTPLIAPEVADATSLGQLPASIDLPRLPAASHRPFPTNRWWSLGAAQSWPSPLYAWPLAARLDDTGVTLVTPRHRSQDKAIVAEWIDPLIVQTPLNQPDHATVESWGDWNVTFAVRAKTNEVLLELTLAEGSPFAFFQSRTDTIDISLSQQTIISPLSCEDACGSALSLVTATGQEYLVVADYNSLLSHDLSAVHLSFKDKAGNFTIVTVAPGSLPRDYLASALRSINDTKATFTIADTTITTTYHFDQETVYGVFPHQAIALRDRGKIVGTQDTLRGTITFYRGKQFTTSLPRPALLPALPAQSADDESFRNLIATEIASEEQIEGVVDIYTASKHLLRQAQLAELAVAYGAENANTILELAKAELSDWCTFEPGTADHNFFSYENHFGGIIASQPAFGSEHYNDHHFQFGYIIHAANILQRLDPTIEPTFGDCISLLQRDIAAIDRTDAQFPYLRYFDPYAGHSWAHGITQLSAGNNQESTSEAIHAWYAMALWGKETGNEDVTNYGLWLLSQEIASARTYWFNSYPEYKTLPEDFSYPMISILWGGKADYSSFFSAAPEAIHGIQFFPATPALFEYLDDGIVDRLVRPARKNAGNSLWRQSLAFAEVIHSSAGIPNHGETIGTLDPVYSQSYWQHWLSTLNSLGTPDLSFVPHQSCGRVFNKQGSRTAVIYRYANDDTKCIFTNTSSGKELSFNKLSIGWNIILLQE